MFLALIVTKKTSASGEQSPPDPLDPMPSYFSGNYILPYIRDCVLMSLYAVVLLKVGGGGGGKVQ